MLHSLIQPLRLEIDNNCAYLRKGSRYLDNTLVIHVLKNVLSQVIGGQLLVALSAMVVFDSLGLLKLLRAISEFDSLIDINGLNIPILTLFLVSLLVCHRERLFKLFI